MRMALALAFILGTASADLHAVPNRSSKKDQVMADRRMLQGSWVMVRWQRGASVVVYNPSERLYVWTIRGDKLNANQGALGWQLASIATLDPTVNPKALDALDGGPNKGKTGRYIYDLNGDTLTIGYAGDGQPRPKAFAGQGTQNTIIIVFVREKR